MRPHGGSPGPGRARRLVTLVALAVVATLAACGDEEGRCGPLTRLCADDGRWQRIAPRVDDAVAVDLDGDGEDEYVVLDRHGELLAVGSGTFGSRSTVFLTGEKPMAIAALPGAVAVALSRPPVLAIFAADESGQLTRRRDIALPDDATALVASDLAGDGAPELVTAIPDAEAIVVIDPETATMYEHPVGSPPGQFAVGDVDGDGHLDVVVFVLAVGLKVLRGTGDGGLREGATTPGSGQPELAGIALADHDGDGDLDAFTRAGRDEVLVRRNNGDGDFSTPIALPLDLSSEGLGMAVGPVADNGLVGVSVPSPNGMATWFGKGSVWLGRIDEALGDASSWIGGGTDGGMLVGGIGYLFRWVYRAAGAAIEVWRSEEIAGSVFSTAVTTGHLDGDHLLDVAVVSQDRLTLLRGRADRGLEPVASLELPSGFRPEDLVIADVTGDGRGDVLVSEGLTVWLAQASEDGQYVLHPRYVTMRFPAQLVPVRTGPEGPAVVLTSPTNQSGQSFEVGGSSVLRFDEAGALIEEIDLVGEDAVFGAAAVDFDEDGVDELLLYRQDVASSYLVHMSPAGDTYVADATYDLVALTNAKVAFEPYAFAVGDLDDDGQVEVVVAGHQETVVVSGLADGAPVATIGPALLPPRHLRDLDGDGVLDAAALSWMSLAYYHGRGDGTFDPESIGINFADGVAMALAAVPEAQFDLVHVSRSEIATHLMRSVARPVIASGSAFHGPVNELVVADVDQDGSDDVVTASSVFAGGVGVWWGGEEEPLTRMSVWVPGQSNYALAVADLDADGDLEALVAYATGEIEAYPFAQRRAGAPSRIAETGTQVQSLAVADVDRDGLPDLVGLLVFADDVRVMAVARGVAPLQFAEFKEAVEFAFNAYSTLELGDVGGDGDLDILIRSKDSGASAFVRADAPGEWAKAEVLPGMSATFSPPDAAGRVEVVTHDGTSIHRLRDGDPERSTLLLQGEARVGWQLLDVADVDGNGQYDLVVGDDKGTHVWLRRDDELARVTLCDLPLWNGVAFPDVDGDGRRDLVGLGGDSLFVRRTRP
ncbi:VCBS repeat-containing protein [Nannocystis sp. SCPEA4]|uniref:FG-GAP repeat domain-containing protein n=1 Tax=Nannocystis sp. SCPEA4 TaxID=2996787 RepID=UPI00226EF837|nr:VCBS repeat-containing protein [Nannocystis sp. SCPEA4]MCY1061693.1 VCBS repeat-containing protein [Nannocystis sp. SCPEA4]